MSTMILRTYCNNVTPTGDAGGTVFANKANMRQAPNSSVATATSVAGATEKVSFTFSGFGFDETVGDIVGIQLGFVGNATGTLAGEINMYLKGSVVTVNDPVVFPSALVEQLSMQTAGLPSGVTKDDLDAGVAAAFEFIKDSGTGNLRVDSLVLAVEYQVNAVMAGLNTRRRRMRRRLLQE